MSAADNGGPAFPTSNGGSPDEGMTLRDYFAAKAMQGMCTSFVNVVRSDMGGFLRDMPMTAYEIADAMLKARAA